jgi:RecB family exonuclease
MRVAAALRLARLAGTTAGGRPLASAADPALWGGTRALTRAEVAIVDPGEPVRISASKLEGIRTCAARWFLEREAGGSGPSHQSAALGTILHKIAEEVATGEAPAEVDALMAHVEQVWDRMEFRTPWAKEREFVRARAAIERFLAWHRDNPRELFDTEVSFATVIDLDDGTQVKLNGYADRIEFDDEGRVVVVALKTGRRKAAKIEENIQLRLYQHAVDADALDERVGRRLAAGGAELLQVGTTDADSYVVQQQTAPADTAGVGQEFREDLGAAVGLLRAERFPASPGGHCQWCAFRALCPAQGSGSVIAE